MEVHLAYLENRVKTLDKQQQTADTITERALIVDLLALMRLKALCYIDKLPRDIFSLILRSGVTMTGMLALSLVCRGFYRHIHPVFMKMATAYRTRHPLAGNIYVATLDHTVSHRLPLLPSSPPPPARKIQLPPPLLIPESSPCFRCRSRGHLARECPLPCRHCKRTGHTERVCPSLRRDTKPRSVNSFKSQ